MPPKTVRAKVSKEDGRLSQREIEIVAMAWCSVKSAKDGKPVVDFPKFTKMAGYKTADSARHAWRPVEKKLEAIAAASNAHPEPDSAPTTPVAGPSASVATPPKRKSGPYIGDDATRQGIVAKKSRYALSQEPMRPHKKKGTLVAAVKTKAREEEDEADLAAEDSWNEYESFDEIGDGEA
ncbi:uncharacterized protein GGS22DRAFT_173847 [Annulohypoxylon maeteangense]|uniref:uncharacterized protein n=1 Tax=Annulohypoxylon maeteangense TaxID=1927788 RepID=UPI002007612A|nr:uncharacterized protein GGS22DRAFT_173847 [Annulohypoxylon maeteangense]KAI0880958.1 hypothetical protein GGS22DRAFT_173847 [Annulohypoxylon maeteangense]